MVYSTFSTIVVAAVAGTAAAQSPVKAAAEPAVPAWAIEEVPEAVRPFRGKAGLGAPWTDRPGPLGSAVAGIDRWQANHFVVHRKETAEFLYSSYTPTVVAYRAGSLPAYGKVVAQYTAGLDGARAKATALLIRAMLDVFRHPTMPPCGKPCRADRALLDEDLLATGTGFCNEQARVFVRLCQVAGIPARIVFLFYSDGRTGHVVAEFFADGRWAMADTSWYCVFPDKDGRLLSAAECHDGGTGQACADAAYKARFAELLKMTDAELGGRNPARQRKSLAAKAESPDKLGTFGLLNYPLPAAAAGR